MIPGNRSLRKTCSIAPADQASARRHLAGRVMPGQLCPDLPGGRVIAGLLGAHLTAHNVLRRITAGQMALVYRYVTLCLLPVGAAPGVVDARGALHRRPCLTAASSEPGGSHHRPAWGRVRPPTSVRDIARMEG